MVDEFHALINGQCFKLIAVLSIDTPRIMRQYAMVLILTCLNSSDVVVRMVQTFKISPHF